MLQCTSVLASGTLYFSFNNSVGRFFVVVVVFFLFFFLLLLFLVCFFFFFFFFWGGGGESDHKLSLGKKVRAQIEAFLVQVNPPKPTTQAAPQS